MEKIPSPQPSLFSLFGPYKGLIGILIVLTIAGNGLSLFVPKIIASGIDSYLHQTFVFRTMLINLGLVSMGVLVFSVLASIVQTYASEKVAKDLRERIVARISRQSYAAVELATPAKILTNLTGDVDSIKLFVSQAIVSLVSSAIIIVGASIFLFSINWKLAIAVLLIICAIGVTFFVIFAKVKTLFTRAREVIDRLNKVINDSILGAALIRVLYSQRLEHAKFLGANAEAKSVGMAILALFASMIPIITFVSNLALLVILILGGKFVIGGTMTLGDFSAFNNYVLLLIFPILIIGFVSNLVAQAQASFGRIAAVLYAPEEIDSATLVSELKGAMDVSHLFKSYAGKPVLKDISFSIAAGTRTAIVGPTAAGKTQLLYLLIGLSKPDSGTIRFDGIDVNELDKKSLHRQIGLVFQDSSILNMSVRENIAFNASVSAADFDRAVRAAELSDFIDALPEGLDTIVAERGGTLSGGQKQRIMLARALALNPKILLLDDFTARVDGQTEQKILANLAREYPQTTVISVTQKIASIEHYEKVLVLMEGELIALGTHAELLTTSPEYVQMYESQKSTNQYELRT